MATESKKDPSVDTAAEKALEAALASNDAAGAEINLDDFERKIADAAQDLGDLPLGDEIEPANRSASARTGRQRDFADDAGGDLAGSRAGSRGPATPAEFSAANDSNSAINDLLYSLQTRPSSRPYWIASILTVLWLALVAGAYFWLRSTNAVPQITGAADLLTKPSLTALVGAAIVAPVLFFVTAIFLRRTAEMRQAANAMTAAAVRLLQPETVAADSVATVGRAIRREVASIGDGMERALARAGELENLVQSEVGILERSYSDAEVRLRRLVNELVDERKEILSHVELLKESLADTHSGIATEVDAVAGRVESAVLATTGRMIDALDRQGNVIAENLEGVTQRISEVISLSGESVSSAISDKTLEIDQRIQDRVTGFDIAVNERLSAFGTVLGGRITDIYSRLNEHHGEIEKATSRVEGLIGQTIGNVGTDIASKGAALVKALGMQTSALEQVMDERTKKLSNVIGERLTGFGSDMTTRMDSLVARLQDRANSLDASTTRIETTIVDHVTRFDQTLRERALDVARSFSEGSQVLSTVLEDANTNFTAKAEELRVTVDTAQVSLFSGFDERIHAISHNLSAGHQRIVSELDKLDNRSTGLLGEIQKRGERMGQVVSEAGRELAGLIDERTSALQTTLASGQMTLVAELDKMDNRSTGLVAEIDKRTVRMGEVVAEAGGRITTAMEQRTAAINAELAQNRELLAGELDRIDSSTSALSRELEKRTARMDEVIGEAGGRIASVMELRTSAINADLAQNRDLLAGELERLGTSTAELSSELEKRTRQLGGVVNEASKQAASILDTRIATINAEMAHGRGLLSEELDRIDASTVALTGELERRTQRLDGVVSDAARKAADLLDARTAVIAADMAQGRDLLAEELERVGTATAALSGEFEKRTTRLNEVVTLAGSNVSRMIDDRSAALAQSMAENREILKEELSRLDQTSEFFGKAIDSRTEKLEKTVAEAGIKLASTIDARSVEIAGAIGQNRQLLASEMAKLDETVVKFADEIDSRTQVLGQAVDEAGGRITRLINDSSRFAGDSIREAGIEVVKNFDDQGLVLRDRVAEAGSLLQDTGSGILGSIEERTTAMRERLVQSGASLQDAASGVIGSIEERTAAMRERLVASGASLQDAASSIIGSIDGRAALMRESLVAAENTLQETAAGVTHSIDERTAIMRERLLESGSALQDAAATVLGSIDQRTSVMTDRVAEAGETLASLIDTRTEAVSLSIEAGRSLLSEQLDRIDNSAVGLGAEMDKRAAKLGATIGESAAKFVTLVENRASLIYDNIGQGQERIAGEIEKLQLISGQFAAIADQRTARIGETLLDAGSRLAYELDSRTENIASLLNESEARLAEEMGRIEDRNSGLIGEIDKRTERLGDLLSDSVNRISSTIDERGSLIQENLAAGRERLVTEYNRIEDRNKGVVSELDKRSLQLGEMLVAANKKLSATMDERTAAMAASLTTGQQKLVAEFDKMANRSDGIVAEIDKRTDRIAATVIQAGQNLTSSFEAGAVKLRQDIGAGRNLLTSEIERINKASADLLEELNERTTRLGEAMQTAASHIGDVVDDKNRSIFAIMRESRDELMAEIDAGALRMVDGIAIKRSEITDELASHVEATGRQLEARTASIADLLAERAQAINTSLGEELVEAQRGLERRAQEFSQVMAQRIREMAQIINDHGRPVADDMQNNAEALINDLQRVGGHLASEISSLISVVTDTTGSLDDIVSRTGRSISVIEKNIVDGTARLAEAVDKASSDSETTRQTAERTATTVAEATEYLLNNINGASFRFEKQGKQLREAAEAVATAQRQLAAVLTEKQEPMERLAQDLTTRTAAIEQSIINFSSVLSGLIQDMVQKTNTAGTRVTDEVRSAFDSSLEKLAETVDGMRLASEQIRRELEDTRGQMRKGIMEMPAEVAESADSMRRVLVDQIMALKELSDIVAKSGKAHDATSSSQSSTPRLSASRAATLQAPQETVRADPEDYDDSGNGPVMTAPSRQGGARAPGMPAASSLRSGEARTAGSRTSETRTRATPVAPSAADDKSGWVSDLLRRASTDDEPAPQPARRQETPKGARPALHAIESLNSISMDIAKAIDQDAAVELWDRYRRGERNVFTRRLYTLQGQKTFDEIRSKYVREAEFRAAVDRYIADFEKLLGDVGKHDRDNMMVQTYLTSDHGKVYTMLAHAAGRLGD